VNNLIVEYPFYVRMFGISGHLRTLALPHRTFEKPPPVLEIQKQRTKSTKANVGINTPTHFYESNIDPQYRWNEWDMRREALTLANLRNKKTTSAQTHVSHFRRESSTQDYLKFIQEDGTMPGTGSQTKRTSSTAMPIKKRYIRNLDGLSGPKLSISTLTLDWDQSRKKEW